MNLVKINSRTVWFVSLALTHSARGSDVRERDESVEHQQTLACIQGSPQPRSTSGALSASYHREESESN